MYVTRYLSHYKSFPEALSSPPEGPNSGYLVIQDVESETYTFFGLSKNRYLAELPFPQNKVLTTSSGSDNDYRDEVIFIPVLNQPLSSNRYYAIQPHGSHKGEAFVCAKEEDMSACCFSSGFNDIKPRPLNPQDVYQQFEIVQHGTLCNGDGTFYARSLASDGFPPHFLRNKGWEIYTKTPKNYELGEADGVNSALRGRLPEFNFPLSVRTSEPVTVGKWYCPFLFIKEGKLSDQVKNSIFYEMTLEQRWERILECENKHNEGKAVSVNVAVQTEAVFLGESRREAIWDEKNVMDGAIWFTSFGNNGEESSVGLSLEIVQRMKWEEERVGWTSGGETRIANIDKKEKFEGIEGWRKFGCYVLVERFSLKKMDKRLVLAYDFKHTHQIKSRFE